MHFFIEKLPKTCDKSQCLTRNITPLILLLSVQHRMKNNCYTNIVKDLGYYVNF